MSAMKKLVSIAAVLVLSGALASTAAASLRTYLVGSRYVKGVGTTVSFKGTVKKPYKIIFYCQGPNARCASKTVCVRGSKVFTQDRTGLTPGTWNLKKASWFRPDSCRFTVTIRSGAEHSYASVQATVRS
jgi:hypothetical protein